MIGPLVLKFVAFFTLRVFTTPYSEHCFIEFGFGNQWVNVLEELGYNRAYHTSKMARSNWNNFLPWPMVWRIPRRYQVPQSHVGTVVYLWKPSKKTILVPNLPWPLLSTLITGVRGISLACWSSCGCFFLTHAGKFFWKWNAALQGQSFIPKHPPRHLLADVRWFERRN